MSHPCPCPMSHVSPHRQQEVEFTSPWQQGEHPDQTTFTTSHTRVSTVHSNVCPGTCEQCEHPDNLHHQPHVFGTWQHSDHWSGSRHSPFPRQVLHLLARSHLVALSETFTRHHIDNRYLDINISSTGQ